jgi:5-dehydro-2-deoxygluconokinase
VVAFANAAGGIVASRLLCSQAMPYEAEVQELLDGMPA